MDNVDLQHFNYDGYTGDKWTEDTVRARFTEKHGKAPDVVCFDAGVWFAGPTSERINLRRFLHPSISSDAGDASVALALALACAVAVVVVLLGGVMMGGGQ
jgi:hypothetical protein